ncbi:hypothetical protein ABZV93_03085 [Actinopolymorpha sp. NPDC004070]|uniref:hypothetical protein n=1 Tax=Actinopolymorpha sp. NPDC004070 TaxID=3154548 RepID=UPI0033A118E7
MYGSLLAGSVVAGAGGGDHPLAPLDLGIAVLAAFPPSVPAFAGALLGWPANVVSWLALVVAVAGGVLWAVVATAQAGAGRSVVVLSACVNLVLGLAIVGVKSLVLH